MNRLKWSICGGVVSVLAWSSTTSLALGQGGCACHRSGSGGDGMVYESSLPPMSDADVLLAEIDNPVELINLTVIVQEKAIVSINGEPTFTMGSSRPYIVRGLTPGKNYKFEIEGVLKNETGAEYAAKETVMLKAGESKQVVLHLRRRNRPKPPVLPPLDPRLLLPPPIAAK